MVFLGRIKDSSNGILWEGLEIKIMVSVGGMGIEDSNNGIFGED